MTFEKSQKMRARMGKQLQIAHQMVKGPNPFGAPGFIACVHTTGRAPDRSVIMSQYVQRATGVAKQAAEVFSKRVVPPAVEYYNATMAKNAQYVVKDPAAVDKLGKQLVYSNLAKLPVMVEGAQAEMNIVKQKWAGRMDLPMTEV
jgi:F-type H+-transporting ATPase subunit g